MYNRHEKLAFFNLSVLAIAILLFFILTNAIGLERSWGAFGILGFSGIGHLLFLRRKRPSEIVDDERDIAIKMKATTRGIYFSWMFYIIASMAIYFISDANGVVSVDLFPLFVWVGYAVSVAVSSIITLVQYRKGTTCGTC